MILVVDDHEGTCEVLARLLTRAGYPSACILDSVSALDLMLAMDHAPTLVILDYMMPGKTGLELFQEMKQSAKLAHVPVLFFSAAPKGGQMEQALALGAVGWITKGNVEWSDLLQQIIRAVPPSASSAPSAPENEPVSDTFHIHPDRRFHLAARSLRFIETVLESLAPPPPLPLLGS